MAKHRRGSIAGAFAWRLIEMLESPAHRALSLSARKILDRLEIELYRHGGKPEENGRLPCTFNHFVEFGVHRHAIGPGIRELVALGFVEITRKGSAGNAGYRQSTLYRLTYRHAGSDKRITDDWRRIETIEDAEAVAEGARKEREGDSRPRSRAKNKSPVSKTITGTSDENRTNRGHSPVTETITTSPVSETITTSISRRGTPQHIDGCRPPDHGASDGSRFRCRRAGAPSFQRWGQVAPEAPAPAKRSRSAGGLSQARWRAAADSASNSQRPTVFEALPPNAVLSSNAQHAEAAQRTVDACTSPLAQ
jgi:hypothetical protein